MKSFTKNKGLMLAIAIFILVIAFYNFFIKEEVTVDRDNATARDAGADLVETLEELRSITFDQTFLASPAYRSLTDYSVDLADEPVGRSNPFAPIGQ